MQSSRRSGRNLSAPKQTQEPTMAQEVTTKLIKKVKIANERSIQTLNDIANLMRVDAVEITSKAGSGHPTSSNSCADIMAALFFDEDGMRYFAKDPAHLSNDRLVLSKGHAAPILYAAWHRVGYFTKQQIMTLRSVNSNIEGHPTPDHPFVDVATGSLGQGLGVACGMAYSSKFFEQRNNNYFCVMGDGEIQEGSVWEACYFASSYKLNNLTAIVDCNQFGQSNTLGHDKNVLENYKRKFEAFGWTAQVIDGHNMVQILDALSKARKSTYPYAIIAKTFKGRNCGPDVENNKAFHGKPLGDKAEAAIRHLQGLIQDRNASLRNFEPTQQDERRVQTGTISLPFTQYDTSKTFGTRDGYGNALNALGRSDSTQRVIGLDADLKNSTFADRMFNNHPNRFVECFISEQNMVSVASGIACRGRIPFCSTFACFFTRAFDQIRMAGISKLNIKFTGSHCGISIGEDGSSQMGLEDLGMFRSVPNSVVLYPSDAVATEKAVELVANYNGITYIRTGRMNVPIQYQTSQEFHIGKCIVAQQSDSDRILVVGGGVTFQESMQCYQALKSQNINIRVVDIFSIKPIDREGLISNAKACGNRILVVEDHYPEGAAVVEALGSQTSISIHHLCVNEVPKSGKGLELFEKFGISAKHIENKIRQII